MEEVRVQVRLQPITILLCKKGTNQDQGNNKKNKQYCLNHNSEKQFRALRIRLCQQQLKLKLIVQPITLHRPQVLISINRGVLRVN